MSKLRLTAISGMLALGLVSGTGARAQLGIDIGIGASGLLPSGDSGGIIEDVIDGIGDIVDPVGDIVDPVGDALEETVETLQNEIFDHGAALEAVAQQLALPLDQLLAIIAEYLTGPVIDVRLLRVLDTLIYEVKTIADAGVVVALLFYANTGEPVRDQELIDAYLGG